MGGGGKIRQSIVIKSNEIARGGGVVGRFSGFCVEEVQLSCLTVRLHRSESGHIERCREAAADRCERGRFVVAEEVKRVCLGWFLGDGFWRSDVETHLGEGRALGGSVCLEHAIHGSSEIFGIALELLCAAKLRWKFVLDWFFCLRLLLWLAEVEFKWVSKVAVGLEHALHCVEIIDVLSSCDNWCICGRSLSCEGLIDGAVWTFLC